MSVQEQTPFIEYECNGVTKIFPLNFDCHDSDHLIVRLDDVNSPTNEWILSDGSIIFHTAPKVGSKLSIQRNTPLERLTEYNSYDNSMRPPVFNHDFDRIWWKLQELGLADWLLGLKLEKEIQDRIAADIYYYTLVTSETDYKINELKEYLEALINNLSGGDLLPILDKYIKTWSGRTQDEKNKDIVHIDDYEKFKNGDDWLPAFVEALSNNKSLKLSDGFEYKCSDLPPIYKHSIYSNKAVIKLDSGRFLNKKQSFRAESIIGAGLKIEGQLPAQYNATHYTYTGTIGNYELTLHGVPLHGINVGDWLIIRDITSVSGYSQWIKGIWQVVSITSTTVTLRCTCQYEPTVGVVSSIMFKRFKTVLQFDNTDGFIGRNGALELGYLAIIGDYDLNNPHSNIGAHGFTGGAPVITNGQSSNAPAVGNGNLITELDTGFANWSEQGIAAEQSYALSINLIACCSNRKRGCYISTNVGSRGKFGIFNGNGEDGLICDEGGSGVFNLSVACGNKLNGFWAQGGGKLGASNCYALCNGTNGGEARGLSWLGFNSSFAIGNKLDGILADRGQVQADGALCELNVGSGFNAHTGAIIRARNASSKNNSKYGVDSRNSTINFDGSGTFIGNGLGAFNSLNSIGFENNKATPYKSLVQMQAPSYTIYNGTGLSNWANTSLGAHLWGINGSYLLNLTNDYLRPNMDSGLAFGSADRRIKVVYAESGTINTSDERLKQQFRSQSDREKDAALEIKRSICLFKFNDAVDLKGNGARWHCGVKAQQVIKIMEKHGLHPFEYSFICYDEWSDEFESILEEVVQTSEDGATSMVLVDTGKKRKTVEAGNRYSVRYDGLSMFILSAI